MSASSSKTAACVPACAPNAPEPGPVALDPGGGDTARHSATVLLSRIATLCRTLAEAVEDLSKLRQIQLAGNGETSVMDGAMSKRESTGPGELLTVSDLARIFKVNEKTIRTWRDEGRLPEPIEMGAVVRWHPGVLDDFLRGGAR